MAFRQMFDAVDEIPEPLREHYAEKDGKWLLQTDPPVEDVSGLKNALNDERRLRRDADKALSDMKVRFEGIEPDEVTKLRERVKGLDDAEIYDKQGLDALVLRRTDSMKAEHERVVALREREIGQLKASVNDLQQRWEQDRIKTALLHAGAAVGVWDRAMEDFVQRGMAVFNVLDEKGNPIIRTPDGEVRYGKDGINPLQPEEWGLALKPQAPHLWPPSSGGGAPVHHGQNGSGIDWSKLPPTERLTKYRELQAAHRP